MENTAAEVVKLDGKEVAIQEVEKAKAEGKKIVETSPGIYKTLNKLKG
jgi:hypothetical protein